MIWQILFILVLILANGLFAAAETSLIAARKGRLEQQAEEGNRNARRALELARNPDLFLPTAQIGISVVTSLGAAYGGDQVVHKIKAWLARSFGLWGFRPAACCWRCGWVRSANHRFRSMTLNT